MGHYIDNSKNNLFQDTALQNRLNGVSGHTMLGTFLVGNTTQLLSFGTSIFNSISNNNDSTGTVSTQEETCDIENQNKILSDYNKALKKYSNNPNDNNKNEVIKIYKSIKNIDNFPSIKRSYELITKRQSSSQSA